jgi:hypothetical protein
MDNNNIDPSSSLAQAGGSSTSGFSTGGTPSPPPPCFSNSASTIAGSSTTNVVATPQTTKHLAMCITTSGIYKTLVELDLSNVQSDATLFEAMKRSYRKARGYKSHFASLFKPRSVEFVHVSYRLQEQPCPADAATVQPLEHPSWPRLDMRQARKRPTHLLS